MKKIIFILLCLLVSSPAWGQASGGVRQSGVITPGDVAVWNSNNVIKDGGGVPIPAAAAFTVAACTNSNDQTPIAAAEVTAYNTRTSVLLPSGAPGCTITNQIQQTVPTVSLFQWPKNPAYDFGELASNQRGNYISVFNGTGGVSTNSPNNCLFDTNGQISFSFHNINWVGNYYTNGTVFACNSYFSGGNFTRYPAGNSLAAPEVWGDSSSVFGFGNVQGCATNGTDNSACVGGSGNGTLAGNLMFGRYNQFHAANVGTVWHGHLADLMVSDSELVGQAGVLICGDDTPCTSPFFSGRNRIEETGGQSGGPYPGINLACVAKGVNFNGIQFDSNAGEDVRIGSDNSCAFTNYTINFSGNTHSQAGTTGGATHQSFYTFVGSKSAVPVGSISINDTYSAQSITHYIADFEGTTDNNIYFTGGNQNSAAFTVSAFNFGTETPADFLNLMGGGSEERTVGSIALGTTAPTSGASVDLGSRSDSLLLPVGTTAARPTGVNGMIRYNSSTPGFEGYANGAWGGLGGGSVTWPTSADVVISNGTNTPAGVAPVANDCLVGNSGGTAWVAGTCSGSSANVALGTSASATNPQKSGDLTTGLYSANTGEVDISSATAQVASFNTNAASTAGVRITGTPYTAGSTTTAYPLFSIWPAGTTAPTWHSAAGAMFDIVAPSGFTGDIMDWHLANGASLGHLDIFGGMVLGTLITTGTIKVGNAFVLSASGNTLLAGGSDSATPVAATILNQRVSTGTSNTAGQNLTIGGGVGTGTGAGGSIILQTAPAGTTGSAQNSLVNALTINSAGLINIGTGAPANAAALDLSTNTTSANSSIILPVGTTAARPTGVNGMMRYNSTNNLAEGFINGAWSSLIASTNGVVPCTEGGTGVSSGTSGGLLYFSSTTSCAVSASFVTNDIIVGGGTGNAPVDSGLYAFLPTDTTIGASIAIGSSALSGQTSSAGYGNVAIGYKAIGNGAITTAGVSNTAIGNIALQNLTTGNQNTVIGNGAATQITTSNQSVAVGYQALDGSGTTAVTGNDNTALGREAGFAITSGADNTLVGDKAGVAIVSNSQDTVVGSLAAAVLTGGSNTIIGYGVANTVLTTGTGNILIGTSSATTTPASGSSNEINIGNLLFYNTASTAAPAVSACGTSPSIDANANNKSGTVTVGTVAATSCTITFAGSGYTTWNHCRVTSETAGLAAVAYSYTKTAITITGTSLVGGVFDYDCDGY